MINILNFHVQHHLLSCEAFVRHIYCIIVQKVQGARDMISSPPTNQPHPLPYDTAVLTLAPVCPGGPGGPRIPCSPRSPCTPGLPGRPVNPLSPFSPTSCKEISKMCQKINGGNSIRSMVHIGPVGTKFLIILLYAQYLFMKQS